MHVVKRDPNIGYLSDNLYVPKQFVNVQGIKNALTIPPTERQLTPTVLWRETAHHIACPREFWRPEDFQFEVIDCRPQSYPHVRIKSKIVLDELYPAKTTQRDALSALLECRGGILQLSCGGGKSPIALELAARMQVPTLIVMDTEQLIKQWRESIDRFLILPDEVGRIQSTQFKWKRSIVLATYHTLARHADNMPEEVRRWFGLIVFEEAHHLSAPTFSKTADLFYGKRICLTATPERADGLHIVYNFHVGPVVYKNLAQELVPRIIFRWSGLSPDITDMDVRARTHDSKGELHLGMLAGYFGGWRPRLEFLLNEVRMAVAESRKILVLSTSVAELINLLALWNGQQDLYTDIPFPTAQEVGSTLTPIELTQLQKKRFKHKLVMARKELKNEQLNPIKRQHIEDFVAELDMHLKQSEVWDACASLHRKRQRKYLADLLAKGGSAGLMIHAVDADTRTELLRSKQVTFAIAKYGREGLDERSLDTVIVCEPFSDKNTLQQLLGRVLRKKEGKKAPTVVFVEDDVGILIGMCQKLKGHMRNRPEDEGGPLAYELHGHPSMKRDKVWSDNKARQQLRTPGV